MGTIAETIFVLTFRQTVSVKRGIVLLLVCGIPLLIAVVASLTGVEWGDDQIQGLIQWVIGYTTLPLVSLIVAAPIFADEIEDRTFTNLMLAPIARWKIALPKVGAAVLIVAVPLIISVFISVVLVFETQTYNAAIVAAFGMLIGTVAFVSLFAFVGTLTTRAVVFGIVYVFGFETIVSSTIPGLKYISISGNTLAIMQELSSTLVDAPKSGSTALPPIEFAVPAIIAVIIVCNILTVWRIKRMDVH